ncbi:MAG: NUDIX domain-containing protein [Chloroflexota bacterium]|nr:NUDIX domain-containing protein [Chloroflexota bacterium]
MVAFEDSYHGQLRKLMGNRQLILPSARAIIQDQQGRVLFVRRSDNAAWVMPAGSLELGESIMDCLKREVHEETGLEVIGATPIAIYSEPRFAFTNAYGGQHQMLSIVFRVDQWRGTLTTTTNETSDARFFALNDLPDIPALYRETLADLQLFDGTLIIK